MDRSAVELWRRDQVTEWVLRRLSDRFNPNRQWAVSPADLIPRLQGQAEVLNFLEGLIGPLDPYRSK